MEHFSFNAEIYPKSTSAFLLAFFLSFNYIIKWHCLGAITALNRLSLWSALFRKNAFSILVCQSYILSCCFHASWGRMSHGVYYHYYWCFVDQKSVMPNEKEPIRYFPLLQLQAKSECWKSKLIQAFIECREWRRKWWKSKNKRFETPQHVPPCLRNCTDSLLTFYATKNRDVERKNQSQFTYSHHHKLFSGCENTKREDVFFLVFLLLFELSLLRENGCLLTI